MDKKDRNTSLLCYVKPIMIFLGAFPYKLINIDRRLYTFYQYAIQGTFFLFLIVLYVEVPHLHGPIDKLFQSVSVLSTYSIMYIKGLVCLSKNMSELIVDMVSNEAAVKMGNRKDVFSIYRSIVKRSKMVQIFYITITYSTCVVFIIPSVKYAISWEETKFSSAKHESRYLPYAMWLPFDQHKHHLIALALQALCAFLATNYYCFIQCILVILPLNITFRLKVLATNLRNLNSSQKLNLQRDGSDNVRRELRLCIKEHIDIIRNSSVLNDTIKYLMLLEFLLSSAQLSLILIQLTSTREANVRLFSLFHLFQLLVQLLILYWYADEIRGQSLSISEVLYEMKWYEHSRSVNRSIQIMMIRSQKPLSLTVGPFGEMSLAMAVKIIRAAYTYVTFMQQTYGKG